MCPVFFFIDDCIQFSTHNFQHRNHIILVKETLSQKLKITRVKLLFCLDLFFIESQSMHQLEIVHVIFSNSTMDTGINGLS